MPIFTIFGHNRLIFAQIWSNMGKFPPGRFPPMRYPNFCCHLSFTCGDYHVCHSKLISPAFSEYKEAQEERHLSHEQAMDNLQNRQVVNTFFRPASTRAARKYLS